MNLRPPRGAERWALAAGTVAWSAAIAGRSFGVEAVGIGAAVAVAGVLLSRRGWALAFGAVIVAAAVSGMLSAAREEAVLSSAVPEGPVKIVGVAVDDGRPGRFGDWFLLDPTALWQSGGWRPWAGPALLVSVEDGTDIVAHDTVMVEGTAVGKPGRVRGDPYAGALRRTRLTVLSKADDPLFRPANAVRARIARGLHRYGDTQGAALVSGFLIGDVRRLSAVSSDRLRRAGLTHFVAVSGSNVALFLLLWWVVTAPFAFGPRRRAFAGILGLALFVVITRWEPSVVRAAAMSGLLLVTRAVGIAITPWTALGASVTGLLMVSGELSVDVGFQLSVAATVGVMAGADLFKGRLPRSFGAPLGVTVAAQIAVAPVLLAHFGTIPILSPLANLVASPLVLVSTAAGGVGLLTGVSTVTGIGVAAAKGVLLIAKVASGWPQLGPMAILGVVGVLALGLIRSMRPVVAIGAGLVMLLLVVAPTRSVPKPSAVFLDVGQGDAELLFASGGQTVLIDGGPDPTVLLRSLHRYRVDHIDLMVLSHPHDDHAAGLVAVVDEMPVRRLWHSGFTAGGPAAAVLLERASSRSIPVEVPEVGRRLMIGDLDVRVLGPLRRYASPNDQSLVLEIVSGGTAMLFPGDIERRAQHEIGPVAINVLKVPHQGAATSDPAWLAALTPEVAVISVGANTFGHPSQTTVDALVAAGTQVRRTDVEGDIVIGFVQETPDR